MLGVQVNGKTLYPRSNVRSEKKKQEEIKIDEIENFDAIFRFFYKIQIGRELSFLSNKTTKRKAVLIFGIIETLARENIPTDLFLFAQFEAAKRWKRALWPTHIASERAVSIYRDWVKGFANMKEARESLPEVLSFPEILRKNHEKFLKYRGMGFSDKHIYRIRGREFHPLYLVTLPNFAELDADAPQVVSTRSDQFEAALSSVDSAAMFWRLAEELHCQKS